VSYASRETSQFSGEPIELYLFQTQSQTWRLTSADEPKTLNGQVYTPETIIRTSTNQSQENKAGTIKVSIPKEHAIAQLFVSYIPSTPLNIVIFRTHDGEADAQAVVHFTGRVTMATLGDDCDLNCAPDQDILRRVIPGPQYQKPCNRILYAPGCDVDKNLFKVLATLTFVNSDTIKSLLFATKPDGWFNNGYIEKITERRMVINHVGDTLVLMNGMAGLSVGDQIAATTAIVWASSTMARISLVSSGFRRATLSMDWSR
jgi:hypothetical protein